MSNKKHSQPLRKSLSHIYLPYYFHRALALDGFDEEEREDYLKEVEELIEKERIASLDLDDLEEDNPDTGKRSGDEEEEDQGDQRDVNRFAYGDW